ncbi:MAG: amidohydrolase family protein, partial [Acidimicrobiia bacterium]|nr:amidohydrolase family protein [Acidimicrobiia bacterium]
DRAEPALQAHLDAGVRTVYVSPFKAGGRVDVGELAARSGGRISVAAGSPDVSRDNASKLEEIWTGARTLGLRIHAHAGLDPADAGIVSELGRKGVLGGDVTLVHGTHLSDEDLDTVAARGASLAVAPSSEMAGVLGAPPLQKFLDRNIQPGLAVDDERLSPPDMLAQMRMANSLQHAAYFDLKLAGKAGLPNLLTTRDVIRYATMEGAKTLGLGSVTGSLEAGKQADIVVFRTDKPNIYPINDPIGAVVWGVDRSNVETVIVAGRVRVSEGRVDADIATVRSLVEAAHRRLTPTSGLTGVGT